MIKNLKNQITDAKKQIRFGVILLILGIILIALNLRPSLTAVGSLIGMIQADTGLSNVTAGLLTTLPLIVFAIFSFLAPRIAKRFGIKHILFFSLIVLTAGILLRVLTPVYFLFLGTFMVGMAIAMGNVLLPSIIKSDFPKHVGLMTGIYSMILNFGAGLGSGISVPLALSFGLGWRGALASWAILSILAILVWLPQIRSRNQNINIKTPTVGGEVWRSALAWQVTVFLGIQSLTFYTAAAWLPQILFEWGMDKATAGWMLSIMLFVSIPFTLITPVIGSRLSNQKGLVVISAVSILITFIGLIYFGTTLIILWMIMFGIGIGVGFSLALSFVVFRTTNGDQASSLSGMAQSIGYLLAAIGPLIFGIVHDITGTWITSLILIVILNIIYLFVGLGAGRNIVISSK